MEITLTRAEGMSYECGKPVVVATFAEANSVLRKWADTAPKINKGVHKVDFKITDAGQDLHYDGRFELVHWTVEFPDMKGHVTGFLRYMAGEACPSSMTKERYEAFIMKQATPERRLEFLTTANWLQAQP